MSFEIKSCEIISIERHPRLRNQVRAHVRVALVEDVGTYMLNLNIRVLADANAGVDIVREAVMDKAARVIGRTISAIEQYGLPAAAE